MSKDNTRKGDRSGSLPPMRMLHLFIRWGSSLIRGGCLPLSLDTPLPLRTTQRVPMPSAWQHTFSGQVPPEVLVVAVTGKQVECTQQGDQKRDDELERRPVKTGELQPGDAQEHDAHVHVHLSPDGFAGALWGPAGTGAVRKRAESGEQNHDGEDDRHYFHILTCSLLTSTQVPLFHCNGFGRGIKAKNKKTPVTGVLNEED